MILAEKIIELRKKMGWSQEELAEQLGVSRQSVSKWEGAQSIPDMDKIIKLSDTFSVSTDYLLKDEMGEEEVVPLQTSEPGLIKVTMEEATNYMDARRRNAPIMAVSTFLCVASPILLILLSGLSDKGTVNGPMAIGFGLGALLIMIAIAVAGFMKCSSRVSGFEFLDNQSFETEYGVSGLVKKKKAEFKDTNSRINTISTMLCIVSVIPLIVTSCFYPDDMVLIYLVCLMLLMIAVACIGFVYAWMIMASYNRLLEEGDFTREKKAQSKKSNAFSSVYWLLMVAASMTMMFLGVDKFWIVYPIAGVLFVPIKILFTSITKR